MNTEQTALELGRYIGPLMLIYGNMEIKKIRFFSFSFTWFSWVANRVMDRNFGDLIYCIGCSFVS